MHDVNMDERYTGYDAARTAAAVGPRGPRGWVRVWDADAVPFLHGILTNDIASLEPGTWRYAAYLTPQGRMISDMRVLRRAHDLVLETEPHVAQVLAHRFDASIFTERVGIGAGFPWTGEADDVDRTSACRDHRGVRARGAWDARVRSRERTARGSRRTTSPKLPVKEDPCCSSGTTILGRRQST